jgi:hypothetical protein
MAKEKRAQVQTLKSDGTPGGKVDRERFEHVKQVLLTVLPDSPPGMTIHEMGQAVLPRVPAELFPRGVMWWIMSVKLDMEGRGQLVRVPKTSPIQHVLINTEEMHET